MKTINTLGILIACFSLLASGCGGDDGSDTHIKIEAYWGLSVSHPSFKTIPEAVSYINSLGVKTYHIKCGRLGPFNDTGE